MTIKDVFDTIAKNAREVTPTCRSPMIRSHLFAVLERPKSSLNRLDYWVRTRATIFRGNILTTVSATLHTDGPPVLLNDFPHTVTRPRLRSRLTLSAS